MEVRQPAFFLLKAVLVFSGRCGRCPRCNSCLSFPLLIRMRSPHPGGDPFSHPSGSSVSRPVWVPDRSASGGLSSAGSARPPPGQPGARKHSVPNQVHSVGDDLGLAPRHACRGASNLSQTPGLVESPKSFALGPARFSGRRTGGDQPRPFSSVGSGVQTPLLVHDRSPQNHFSGLAQRRGPRRKARCPSSRATRPWPVCRPVTWWR